MGKSESLKIEIDGIRGRFEYMITEIDEIHGKVPIHIIRSMGYTIQRFKYSSIDSFHSLIRIFFSINIIRSIW